MKRILTLGVTLLIAIGLVSSMLLFAAQDSVVSLATHDENTEIDEAFEDFQLNKSNQQLEVAFVTGAIDKKIEERKAQIAAEEAEKAEQARQAAIARQAALKTQSVQQSQSASSSISQQSIPASQGDGLDYWTSRISYWCDIYGCDTSKFRELIKCESSGNHNKYADLSRLNIGLFQFQKPTFNENIKFIDVSNPNILDGEQQTQLGIYLITQRNEAWRWPTCSKKAGLY